MNYANIIFPNETKIAFVVVGEEALCYIIPQLPLSGFILRCRSQRQGQIPLGFNFVRADGLTTFTGYKGLRPATRADFEKFNVSLAPYDKFPGHYKAIE